MVSSPDFIKASGKDKKEDSEEPKAMWQVHDALCNYDAVMHSLWPTNFAPIVIRRVLADQRYGELVCSEEKDRVLLVSRFFNAVTKENAGRATRRQAPMPYDLAKKKWDRIVCASFPRVISGSLEAQRIERAAEHSTRGRGGGRGNRGNAGGGGGRGGRNSTPRASFRGGPVCFAFNQAGGCGKIQVQGGCKDNAVPPNTYHHVCNFLTKATSMYCLKAHARHNSH